MVIIKTVYGKDSMEEMARILDKNDICLVSVIRNEIEFIIIGQSEDEIDMDKIDAEYEKFLSKMGPSPLRM